MITKNAIPISAISRFCLCLASPSSVTSKRLPLHEHTILRHSDYTNTIGCRKITTTTALDACEPTTISAANDTTTTNDEPGDSDGDGATTTPHDAITCSNSISKSKFFWKDPRNRRTFFDEIGSKLGVRQPEDWYYVKAQQVIKLGGATLLRHYYANSLLAALSSVYPEHEWLPWRFSRAPVRFWKDRSNHRRFFDWAAGQLGITDPTEDWYHVSVGDVAKLGGDGLLCGYYGSSLCMALKSIYPEIEWLEWRFTMVPNGFWSDMTNQRRFFDWVAKQLGVQCMEDWYKIAVEDFASTSAATAATTSTNSNNNNNNTSRRTMKQLLGPGWSLIHNHYASSLVKALTTVYPEYEWHEWRFTTVPMGFWKDPANQRRFFDWAAKQLGVVQMPDDWYHRGVYSEDVAKLGGATLLNHYYGGSLSKALAAVYPEFEWHPWRFKKFAVRSLEHQQQQQQQHGDDDTTAAASVSVESSSSDVVRYIEFLAKELHVNHLDEWYRISVDQIRQVGGYRIIELNGGLYAVLRRLYPEHNWDENRFLESSRGRKKSGQRQLRIAARNLFPNQEIMEDFEHPDLIFSKSGERMQLDVYLPKYRLALEYHGQQHFKDSYFFGPQANYSSRDQEKLSACQRAGITLVVVPHYGWDHTEEGLAEIIRGERPDLLPLLTMTTPSTSTSSPGVAGAGNQ